MDTDTEMTKELKVQPFHNYELCCYRCKGDKPPYYAVCNECSDIIDKQAEQLKAKDAAMMVMFKWGQIDGDDEMARLDLWLQFEQKLGTKESDRLQTHLEQALS